MRLTWAAAAGRLDLVGSPQPIKETHSSLLPQGVRTRVSSTGIPDETPSLRLPAPDWLNSPGRNGEGSSSASFFPCLPTHTDKMNFKAEILSVVGRKQL